MSMMGSNSESLKHLSSQVVPNCFSGKLQNLKNNTKQLASPEPKMKAELGRLRDENVDLKREALLVGRLRDEHMDSKKELGRLRDENTELKKEVVLLFTSRV